MANEEFIHSTEFRSQASSIAAPPYSPVTFHVLKAGAVVYTGEVLGTFHSPQEAFEAGHAAAARWIRKQRR